MTCVTYVTHQKAIVFEQAKVGNEAAIAQLLSFAQPDVRRFAKRTCGAADIDDAVQETLLLLSRRIGTIKMLAALPAWLFTVVKRECLRVARKSGAFDKTEDIAIYESDIQLSSKPENELRVDLIRAIHALPEHHRHVILLRDVEGMSIEEMADHLGRSRDSIKAQLYRARLLVREYLIA